MPTLDDLISELPDDAYLEKGLPDAVRTESDRGVATMCSAMVEQALETALRKKLSHLPPDDLDEWFLGTNAPFRSFNAKIKLGRGVEIYDDTVETKLNQIRKIRNVFAHRSLPLTFDHDGLSASKTPLLGDLGRFPHLTNREIFAGYCLAVTTILRGWKNGQLLTSSK